MKKGKKYKGVICRKNHVNGSKISEKHKKMSDDFFEILGVLIKDREFCDALEKGFGRGGDCGNIF
jgi:hypothetical protein